MSGTSRADNELRPIEIQRGFTNTAAGSVYIKAGNTTILCTASVDETVPRWKAHLPPEELTGWVTAEYNMLPGSTSPRKNRDRNKVDGRTTEIQRLIGRSLRAVVDFKALGPRTIVVDCDVLEADGGTRTLSITGGFLALVDALSTCETPRPALLDSVAAISVGIVDGRPRLDLDYQLDSQADVDMNVIMTGAGNFVEVQGTAEGKPFSRLQLDELLDLAAGGIQQLTEVQRAAIGVQWPLDSI